ncbi:MAG: hypothetical protein ABI787_03030 [Spartobacteria bacterium]
MNKAILLLLVSRLVIIGTITVSCSSVLAQNDALERAADEAARTAGANGLAAGSRVAERFYYVAKYRASAQQRAVVLKNGRKTAGKAKKSRYIAVPTAQDARRKGPVSVMLWDTQSQEIVGNNIYDLNVVPKRDAEVKLDGTTAMYVAQ